MTDEAETQVEADTEAENQRLLASYRMCFHSAPGATVLHDLAAFCRATESCAVPGDRDRTFMLEGRREVFLRIQERLRLNMDELMALRAGRYKPRTEDA